MFFFVIYATKKTYVKKIWNICFHNALNITYFFDINNETTQLHPKLIDLTQ